MTRTLFSFLALASLALGAGYNQSASGASVHGTSISIAAGGWSGSCAAGDTLGLAIVSWIGAATPAVINTPTMSGNTFTLINSTTNLVASNSSSRVSTF